MRSRGYWPEIILVVVVLVAGTIIFRITDLDLRLEKQVWSPAGGWYLKDVQPWRFLYKWGTYPGLLLGVGALGLLIAGLKNPRLSRYRRSSLYLILCLAVGPGLLVNAVFKERWGRPRPRDVIEFGGTRAFVKVLDFGEAGEKKSFPCGHCSMGFYWFALYFLLRNKRPGVALGFLCFGMLYGGMIGYARMAQGGHFASDALWAGGLTFISCLVLMPLVKPDREDNPYRMTASHPVVVPALIFVGILGVGAFLLSTPYQREKIYSPRKFHPPTPRMATYRHFRFDLVSGTLKITVADSMRFTRSSQGFGLPGSKINDQLSFTTVNDTLVCHLAQQKRGLFSDLSQQMQLTIPRNQPATWTIKLGSGEIMVPAEFRDSLTDINSDRIRENVFTGKPQQLTFIVDENGSIVGIKHQTIR